MTTDARTTDSITNGPSDTFRAPRLGLILLLAALLLPALTATAQLTQSWIYSFEVNGGTSSPDMLDIAVTGDGHVVAVGRWNTLPGVVCVDVDTGDLLWEILDDTAPGKATAVVVVPDGSGDVIVGGTTENQGNTAFLWRIDPDGEVVWTRTIAYDQPNNTSESIGALAVTEIGRVFAAGSFASHKAVGWMMAGEPQTHKVYPNLQEGFPYTLALHLTSPSTGLIAGYYHNFPDDFPRILHVTGMGELLWMTDLSDWLDDVEDVTQTLDGTIVYAGGKLQYAGVGALDIDGNPLWEVQQGNNFSGYDGISLTDPAGSNDVYVCGRLKWPDENEYRRSITKVTSTGDVVWTFEAPETGSANGWNAITPLPDGGLVVTGTRQLDWQTEEHVIERYDPTIP